MPLIQAPTSHRAVLEHYWSTYDAGLASGAFTPFVYPGASLGGLVALLFFICVPPSSRLHNVWTRVLVFTFIAGWHALYIRSARGLNVSTSFGIGIVLAFATLWAAALLIFDDAKANAKRLVWTDDQDKKNATSKPARRYRWQSYPEHSLLARLSWTADIWTNFRGLGWSFAVPGLPSLPAHVQRDLYPDHPADDKRVSATGLARFDSRAEALRHHAWLVVKGYLATDVLGTLVRRDKYFWGVRGAPAPAYLPEVLRTSPLLLIRSYRMLVGMSLVWMGLRTVYALGPVIFLGVLDTRILGAQAEPWLYPDQYGSYTCALDRGLAGWWGGWWHQIFRRTFGAAGSWVCRRLGVHERSVKGKLVHVWCAFLLSGVLHACGSATQMGDTRPLRGPMAFFLMQPLGVMLEMGARVLFASGFPDARFPRWAKRAFNFVWVHAWFWLTAPLLVDDIAAGGLWMIDPIPLSPLRVVNAVFGLRLSILGGDEGPLDAMRTWCASPSWRIVWRESWFKRGIAL